MNCEQLMPGKKQSAQIAQIAKTYYVLHEKTKNLETWKHEKT